MFFIGLHPWFIPQVPHLLEQGIRSGRPEGGAPVPFLLVNLPMFWILWLVIVKPPCVHIQGQTAVFHHHFLGRKPICFCCFLEHLSIPPGTWEPIQHPAPKFTAILPSLRHRAPPQMSPFRSREKCGLHGMKKGINQKE